MNKTVLSVVAGICLLAIFAQSALALGRIELGGDAPRLSGPDLEGSSVSLSDYSGKWVYLDFWASWCGPCMQSLPEVVALSEHTNRRSDLAVLGVSLDNTSTLEALHSAVSKNNISYPVIFDGGGWKSPAAEDWGVRAIPSTFLIDPQGRVVARDLPASQVEYFIDKSAGREGELPAGKSVKPGKSSKQKPNATSPLPEPGSPFRVATTESLLEDSPSSGDPRQRDLLVSMKIDGDNPAQKYRIAVFLLGDPSRKPVSYAWRYEVRLIPNTDKRTKSPYYIDIRPAPGKLDTKSVADEAGVALPGKVDEKSMPFISATFDAKKKTYNLVIPVPKNTRNLSYNIALFDPVVGQYINNGLVSVSTGSV